MDHFILWDRNFGINNENNQLDYSVKCNVCSNELKLGKIL